MHRLTLQARLILLVFASILPLLVYDLGSVYLDYRREKTRASQEALSLARSLALVVESELQARIAALDVLATSRAMARDELDAVRQQAAALVARQAPGANILLLREDGQQVMNTAAPPGAPLPARQYLDNQRRVFATGRPSVSDAFFGVYVRRPVIAVDVPVKAPDGSVRLILALNPSLQAFDTVLRRQRLPRGWMATVFDRQGVRLARHPDPGGLVGQRIVPAVLQAWQAGAAEGMAEVSTPDGVPVLAAFSRLPETGWGAAVAVPAAQVTAPAWQAAQVSLIVGLGLLALSLLLARWISFSVMRPIQALRRLATAGEDPGAGPAATGLPEADEVAEALRAEARRARAATASLLDSERRLRLVVGELNHRAKNALATVQSIATQTARGPAGADAGRFTEAFTARLRGLARAHDLLASVSWQPAGLDTVLRAGLAPWMEPGRMEAGAPGRIVVEHRCPGVPPVSPGQAQALVMALHELATNATKYGALSVAQGRVQVTCRAEEGGPGALIEWREQGGPPVAGPPAHQGFGTRLLRRALAHDLGPGGSVQLEFEPAGLRAIIRLRSRDDAHAPSADHHAPPAAKPPASQREQAGR